MSFIRRSALPFLALILIPSFVFASQCNEGDPELDSICRKIEDLQGVSDSLDIAISGAEKSLVGLEKQLAGIRRDIVSVERRLEKTEMEINNREQELAQQEKLLAVRVRSFYKQSRQVSPLFLLFSGQSAADFVRELSYRLSAVNEDKKIILTVSADLVKLKKDQASLEKNKNSLAALKRRVDQQAVSLRKDIEGAKAYKSEVKGDIAELTARQKAILAARSGGGTFTTSVGEVPVSSIPCSGPPGTPTFCDPGDGDWFGAFSFGAWTHRKGLSQYGAKGRAESGQNYKDILRVYYDKEPVGKDTGGTISVVGFGNLDFENYYLMGIAEMPSSWPMEALKAQAVAARSFANRYREQGKPICTTQACQVFNSGKASNPPASWRQAVEETRGQVLEGVVGYYSSTAGGFLTYPRGMWDTTNNQGGPGFASRAWESKAGSPWFYSAWFTQSYTSGSAKCSRSHPWLNSDELADILNAWRVLAAGGDVNRILPETIKSCPIGGASGNPYSKSELKSKADSLGGGFSRVSSASVVYSNNGGTASVNFSTDRGSVSISGSDFKRAFNLRAPGYIAIRSPLFNIEKK